MTPQIAPRLTGLLTAVAMVLVACSPAPGNVEPTQSVGGGQSSMGSAPSADPTGSGAAEPTVDLSDIKVGYIVKTLSNPFWQTYEQGAKAAAEDLGVQLDVRDVATESDLRAQLDVALAMVAQDYDAIVAASITNTNLVPAIAEANEKGIPWIVVSEDQDPDALAQNNAQVTARVRLSFYDEGVVIGEYIADQLGGEGQVGIVLGMAGTSAARDRLQGVEDVFEEFPDLEIVSTQPGDWLADKAFTVASAMMQANAELDAIIAQNDTMALGVAAAVRQAEKTGEILVTGDDGTPEAYQAIQDGDLTATIDGVAWQIAYYSVYAAVKAVVEEAETLEDFSLQPALVTADNVEDVVAAAPKPEPAMFEVNKNPYTIAGVTE